METSFSRMVVSHQAYPCVLKMEVSPSRSRIGLASSYCAVYTSVLTPTTPTFASKFFSVWY